MSLLARALAGSAFLDLVSTLVEVVRFSGSNRSVVLLLVRIGTFKGSPFVVWRKDLLFVP